MRIDVSVQINQLIAAVYQAASGLVPASSVLERLAQLTQSDKAFTGRLNIRRHEGAIVSSFNLEASVVERYNGCFAKQNPWLTSPSFFQAEGLVWRGSEIIDEADLKRSEFYRQFMLPQGMLHTAHIVVRVRGPDILHVVLSRPPAAEAFEDGALEIARLFALHARQALEIQAAFETAQWIEAGIVEATSHLSAGLAVVEPPATIRFISEAARAMFESAANGAGPSNGNGVFPKENGKRDAWPSPVIRLPRPLVEALAQRPIPSSCVLHTANGHGMRPTVVDIRPYSIASDADGVPRIGYVLTCRGGEAAVEVDQLSLRDAFGLTAAEARICAAIAAGDSVESLARRLEISPLTARTHLKHIFEKTYTTRQPELMKLLISMSRRKSFTPASPTVGEDKATIVHLKRALISPGTAS